MPLNVKNKILFACTMVLLACNGGGELSEKEKATQDSLSKVKRRMAADSMKKKNPWLIVPPDSIYTGTYIDRYPNGMVKFRGFFRQGKKHGQWLSFYPTGEQWSEMNFDKGVKHGPNVTFFENTKTRYTGFYKNDQRDSLWQFYDSTGKLLKKVVYRNNRILREQDMP